ncbi:MAG: hypothetical protein M1834_004246 [Cirrosporium novae-zelandiae]|nr:MAG: hypothetical protein M1834_004246 [Cirrosporium novae-zelandiae]
MAVKSMKITRGWQESAFKTVQRPSHPNLVPLECAYLDKDTVLAGINYIHTELKIQHGAIVADNVLLNRDGNIKIANIGESMLNGKSVDDRRKDHRALGLIMVQLMEPRTHITDPTTLKLQHPERWDSQIRDFLMQTELATSRSLAEHEFLERGKASQWFRQHVYITESTMFRDWELLDSDIKDIQFE